MPRWQRSEQRPNQVWRSANNKDLFLILMGPQMLEFWRNSINFGFSKYSEELAVHLYGLHLQPHIVSWEGKVAGWCADAHSMHMNGQPIDLVPCTWRDISC